MRYERVNSVSTHAHWHKVEESDGHKDVTRVIRGWLVCTFPCPSLEPVQGWVIRSM